MLLRGIPAMIPVRVMDEGTMLSGRSGDKRDPGEEKPFVFRA